MKIVIENQYLLNNVDELQDIPSGSIENYTIKWIYDTFQGFQYLTVTQQGVYRARDIRSVSGYWKSDSEYVFKQASKVVDHDYDDVANNCTDITSPLYVNYAYDLGIIDYLLAHHMLQEHCVPYWDTYGLTEKKIITGFHCWPEDGGTSGYYNGTNGLWYKDLMRDYWTDEEIVFNIKKHIVKGSEAKKMRVQALQVAIELKKHDLIFSRYEVAKFYTRIVDHFQGWILSADSTAIFDWLRGDGIYENSVDDGYPNMSWYNEDIKNMALEILEEGNYTPCQINDHIQI